MYKKNFQPINNVHKSCLGFLSEKCFRFQIFTHYYSQMSLHGLNVAVDHARTDKTSRSNNFLANRICIALQTCLSQESKIIYEINKQSLHGSNAVFHIKFMIYEKQQKNHNIAIMSIMLGDDCYQFKTNDCLITIVGNMIRRSRR